MRKNMIFCITILFTFSLITLAYAHLTPEHVSDKIITHSVALVDAYVNALPEPTATFPNGSFEFTLDNNVTALISPIYMNGTVYRAVIFGFPDNTVHAVLLDGLSPGNIDPELVEQVKEELAEYLLDSEMIVKISKENISFNLSLTDNFQIFVDRIYDSINATLAPVKDPTTATVPIGIHVAISPTEKNPVEVADTPTTLTRLKTSIDFRGEEKEIEINVDSSERESKIEIDNKTVTTNKKIEVRDSKLYIETSVGSKEIKILPEEASSQATEITTIEEIKLEEESQKPVYSVKGTKQARILFLIPVSMEVETKVDAETGNIISVNKPWWGSLAW